MKYATFEIRLMDVPLVLHELVKLYVTYHGIEGWILCGFFYFSQTSVRLQDLIQLCAIVLL